MLKLEVFYLVLLIFPEFLQVLDYFIYSSYYSENLQGALHRKREAVELPSAELRGPEEK